MKMIENFRYKKAELITSITAICVYLASVVINIVDNPMPDIFTKHWYYQTIPYLICALPFIVFLIASIISFNIKKPSRNMVYILMTFEVAITAISIFTSLDLRNLHIFEESELVQYWIVLCLMLLYQTFLLLFELSTATSRDFQDYAFIMMLIYALAIVCMITYNFSYEKLLLHLSLLLNQFSLYWFSYELTEENQHSLFKFNKADVANEPKPEEPLSKKMYEELRLVLNDKVDSYQFDEPAYFSGYSDGKFKFDFTYDENTTTVSGKFSHIFDNNCNEYITEKISKFDTEFAYFGFDVETIEMGIEAAEEDYRTFFVSFKNTTFSNNDDNQAVINYILKFAGVIKVWHDAECVMEAVIK